MRTKKLLLSAVALAAGLLSSQAQSNVYSVNVVGYVNVVITNGYNLIANPLDAGNNTVSNLFNAAVTSGAALGSITYTWNGTSLIANANDEFDGTWQSPAVVLAPGTGFFFRNLGASPFTNTFVGTVPQGTLTSPLSTGYTLKSSLTSVGGFLQTDLALTNASPGDIVYLWNGTALVACAKDEFDGSWQPLSAPFSSDANNGPLIKLGQGFFYRNLSGSTINWTNKFTVQ